MFTFFIVIILIVATIVYLWFTFAIVYHLIRFGIGNRPKAIALVFLTGSFILFVAAVITFVAAASKLGVFISSSFLNFSQ
jgi:hypothetical protein